MGFESFNSPPPQEEIPKQPTPKAEIPKHLFSKDPYEVLGVPKNANSEQIEDARKNLQRKFHPDINSDPKANEVAQNINNAFDILTGNSEHAVLGGRFASKTNSQARPENKSQSDYVNDTLNNLWRENEARFKNWQKEQEARFNSYNTRTQSKSGFEQKGTRTNSKTDGTNFKGNKKEESTNENSNEIVTASAEIEMGMFVPSDYFVEVMEYGRLRNVRVDFYIEKETPLSKIYKVEFKGKRKDIDVVANYIKNRPRVKF